MSTTNKVTLEICRLCLGRCNARELWVEYTWMEEKEIYGKMLLDCFNMTLPKYEGYNLDLICDSCINQLRNVYFFKKQIESCQQKLYRCICNGDINDLIPKKSIGKNLDGTLKENSHAIKENFEYADDCFGDIDVKSEDSYFHSYDSRSKDSRDDEAYTAKRKEKSNKINLKTERNVKEKVRAKKACHERNFKILSSKSSRTATREKENISIILEYSTICPFKSSKGHFNCFYCNKPFAVFEDLRYHTENDHKNMESKSIKNCIDRPQVRMVKADISQIKCKICDTKLNDLNSFVDHLPKHNKSFDPLAKLKPNDCILGFILDNGRYVCNVCKMEFKFFKNLSTHMNEHTFNHVCDVCGKCFLMQERLRSHTKLHKNDQVKCKQCGKEFSSNILLRSHSRYAHTNKKFMCSLCQESFKSYRLRIEHLVQVHNIKRPEFVCDICNKNFKTSGSLNYHIKSEHLKIKRQAKYSCNDCNKCFTTMYLLKSHMLVHTGERNHECTVCHKKYTRAKTLKEHSRIHLNDRRFSCGACRQSFIQKCSLKNHIRVHHPDSNVEELILCKKSSAQSLQ